jgi:hypothetical protein
MKRQLQMFSSELEEVSYKRDLAAYAVVGCLNSAIFWAKQGDAAHAASILEAAKTKYDRVQNELNMLELKKGDFHHGNRATDQSVAA